MCDGGHCRDKQSCARWMMRCDIYRCNMYINFNTKAWPKKCPFFLLAPNENYPQKPEDADY